MTLPGPRTLTDRSRLQTPAPLIGDDALVTGTALGRYVLLEPLGEGGMGIVYAAWDFALERQVALKIIRGGALRELEPDSLLLREAQAMARVTHPGINAVYDVGSFRRPPFPGKELPEAGSLAAWLRQAARPAGQVLSLLVQAGRGLAAAHEADLAHGDFKPH